MLALLTSNRKNYTRNVRYSLWSEKFTFKLGQEIYRPETVNDRSRQEVLKEWREKGEEFCGNHGSYFMEVVSSAESRRLIKLFKREKVFQECGKGKKKNAGIKICHFVFIVPPR